MFLCSPPLYIPGFWPSGGTDGGLGFPDAWASLILRQTSPESWTERWRLSDSTEKQLVCITDLFPFGWFSLPDSKSLLTKFGPCAQRGHPQVHVLAWRRRDATNRNPASPKLLHLHQRPFPKFKSREEWSWWRQSDRLVTRWRGCWSRPA